VFGSASSNLRKLGARGVQLGDVAAQRLVAQLGAGAARFGRSHHLVHVAHVAVELAELRQPLQPDRVMDRRAVHARHRVEERCGQRRRARRVGGRAKLELRADRLERRLCGEHVSAGHRPAQVEPLLQLRARSGVDLAHEGGDAGGQRLPARRVRAGGGGGRAEAVDERARA
jgi:hypothetical protein